MHIPEPFFWPLIAVYLFSIFSSTVQSPVVHHVLIDFMKRNHEAFLPSLLVVFGRRRLEIGEGELGMPAKQNTE